MDREVADQRQMIGELNVRNRKAIHLDLAAVKDEIKLFARAAARIGGQAVQVGAGQSGRFSEQVEVVIAPVSIEVAGHDDRLLSLAQQIVQIPELVLPMPELQGQMHQKNCYVIEFQLDDQAFD